MGFQRKKGRISNSMNIYLKHPLKNLGVKIFLTIWLQENYHNISPQRRSRGLFDKIPNTLGFKATSFAQELIYIYIYIYISKDVFMKMESIIY
jgi:hypothetical protein